MEVCFPKGMEDSYINPVVSSRCFISEERGMYMLALGVLQNALEYFIGYHPSNPNRRSTHAKSIQRQGQVRKENREFKEAKKFIFEDYEGSASDLLKDTKYSVDDFRRQAVRMLGIMQQGWRTGKKKMYVNHAI